MCIHALHIHAQAENKRVKHDVHDIIDSNKHTYHTYCTAVDRRCWLSILVNGSIDRFS